MHLVRVVYDFKADPEWNEWVGSTTILYFRI